MIAAISGCGPRDVQTPAALVGDWPGALSWRGESTPAELEISGEGDSLHVLVSFAALGVRALDAGRLAFEPPSVRFTIPDSGGTIAFGGWLRRGVLAGALTAPATGSERNRARLPLLVVARRAPTHALPWPAAAGVGAAPATAPAPERSLGAWMRARAAR
ncbi:MAG TPA: hypothetical protein VMH61_00415 [Candidatus Acidoferrales bacterium]|nr:hypothetical protein [Candidatus Acidoferrales bacterium]